MESLSIVQNCRRGVRTDLGDGIIFGEVFLYIMDGRHLGKIPRQMASTPRIWVVHRVGESADMFGNLFGPYDSVKSTRCTSSISERSPEIQKLQKFRYS